MLNCVLLNVQPLLVRLEELEKLAHSWLPLDLQPDKCLEPFKFFNVFLDLLQLAHYISDHLADLKVFNQGVNLDLMAGLESEVDVTASTSQ